MTTSDIGKVISRKSTLAELAQRGIHNLEQLIQMPPEELQNIPGIGAKTAPRIHASAQSYLQDKPIQFAPLPPSIREPSAILDIRVDPDYQPETPWGFCLSGTTHEKHFFIYNPDIMYPHTHSLSDGRVIQMVPDWTVAWEMIEALVRAHKWRVDYWGKANTKHLNETAPPSVQKNLRPHMTDLHRIFVDSLALPLPRMGLVEVAKYLGYQGWTSEDKPYSAHIQYLGWLRNPHREDLIQSSLDTLSRNTDAVSRIHRWMANQNFPE
jgi:predicted RecB family nuclease